MFDPTELEKRYAFLDGIPDPLLDAIVALPVGTLEERAHGVRVWREALLDGRLPPASTWPPPAISHPARLAAQSLGILRFCKGQPDLVDAFMQDVLLSAARRAEVVRGEVSKLLRELEQLERRRLDQDQERRGKNVDAATLARLREQAELEVNERPTTKQDVDIVGGWTERVRAWTAIQEIFGDLGGMMGRGWDLSAGVLKHTGWSDLVRLRGLVEQLPELREIVRALGRLQVSTTDDAVAETVFAPMRRLEEERREVWTPAVPGETRGIERSGEIARMLPGEAVNLGHPKLRFLWHARRAERALLTYRVEGISFERTLVEVDGERATEQTGKRQERGPIIAVIDTSGSMHGLPEQVAKALILEALRTAHAEKRRCFLYAYSGPGLVIEQELDLSVDGVGRLLTFLGHSFGGGSDEVGVMKRVLARIEKDHWKKADVFFVSDGEWPVPTTLVALVQKAREGGTRFHGVQIGNKGQTGLHAICDPVHLFQDWATAGGWSRT